MQTRSQAALKPLKITCTSSDCPNGLHCFLRAKKLASEGGAGACRSCGVQLVDWSRVHKRDLLDAQYVFEMLQIEMIRHHFFHLRMEQRAINYARRKGKKGLAEAVLKLIRNSVGDAEPFRDGRQTPKGGANPIHYAQHATASCCRRCIEEWHAIPMGRALTEEEIRYLTELAVRYLSYRLPDLKESAENIPPIRRNRITAAS
jgi:hypothetical protein